MNTVLRAPAQQRSNSAHTRAALPRLVVADGTIEALKWLALALMTLDHINKYLFAEKLPGLFELGRLAMPLFGFVLAYNLARPGTLQRGTHHHAIERLGLFGAVATPFFLGLGGLGWGWWPLNIMFMLLIATAIIYVIEKGDIASRVGAAMLFLLGGFFVEFWWFALAYCVAAWWYCKAPSMRALVLWVAAAASLYVVNRNSWALAALPVIYAAQCIDLKMPRIRYAFYVYYPAHLAVLLAVKLAFF